MPSAIYMQLGDATHCCTLDFMAGPSVELAAVFGLLEVISEFPGAASITEEH